MKGILGRKIGMTQIFSVEGQLIPVTVIEVQPNVILQVLENDTNGYNAVRLAVEDKRDNLVTKPVAGQFKKANTSPKRFVKEIRNMTGYNMGDVINVNIFTAGEFVDVTAISKGKGFSGSIKRHNYSRGPMAHGSGYHRGVGSMGAIAPNRIFKSKKMPGHMGTEKVTIQNLEIILVDEVKNMILVKGSVPGPKKQFVTIKQAIKGMKTKQPINLLSRQEQQSISNNGQENQENSIVNTEQVQSSVTQ